MVKGQSDKRCVRALSQGAVATTKRNHNFLQGLTCYEQAAFGIVEVISVQSSVRSLIVLCGLALAACHKQPLVEAAAKGPAIAAPIAAFPLAPGDAPPSVAAPAAGELPSPRMCPGANTVPSINPLL